MLDDNERFAYCAGVIPVTQCSILYDAIGSSPRQMLAQTTHIHAGDLDKIGRGRDRETLRRRKETVS
jgi:hypothetical protein